MHLIKHLFLMFLFSCGFAQEQELVLIIMRHGQADHNLEDIYNSNPSHPIYKPSFLTPLGIQQVKATAEKLLERGFRDTEISAIYASPLPRTVQSAEILCQQGIAPLEKLIRDDRLIEPQAGDLEGLPIIHDWKASYAEQYRFETDEEITARVSEFCKDLCELYSSGVVVVVTHGVIAQKLFSLVSGSSKKLTPGEARIVLTSPSM